MTVLRRLWEGWKAFAHVLGRVQTTILLSIVYAIAIGALALVSRLGRRDLLGLRGRDDASYWTPLPESTRSLERARNQF